MYHVRKVRDLKNKLNKKNIDFFSTQMTAINWKQVLLCAEHHKALYNNNLSHNEYELFKKKYFIVKKRIVLYVNLFYFIFLV